MSYGQGREPVKFAYWVPNVSGGLVISDIEQRTNWSFEYNTKLAQIAERAGILSYPLIFSRAKMQLEVGASLRRLSYYES